MLVCEPMIISEEVSRSETIGPNLGGLVSTKNVDDDKPQKARPLVSIVVPTRNSARTLRECLESIEAQSIACEIIVVDNNSTDETTQIALEYVDKLVRGGPERSAQRNIGFLECAADAVGFIDSDMVLEPTVAEEALAMISGGFAAAVVPEYTSGTGYWTSVRAYERSMYLENKNVEAARFFSRPILEQLGGFNEELTGGEDWDLEIRAEQFGKIGRVTARIRHDEGHLRYLEACRKKGYYAKGYARFARTHGIKTLISITVNRTYIKSPKVLLTGKGIGLAALKFGEMVAILVSVSRQFAIDTFSTEPRDSVSKSSLASFWSTIGERLKEAICEQDPEETLTVAPQLPTAPIEASAQCISRDQPRH